MTHRLLWGDLHNHNAVGLFHYSKGTLERSIDIAKSHLDFFAFTGHAQWHDMPEMPDGAHQKWAEGFAYHRKHWPRTKALIAEANDPGRFTAFLGYEWHSAASGDRSVLYPGDEGDLFLTDDVNALITHAKATGAILVPHHTGYRAGLPGRGTNWDDVDETVSPVIEIYSEHGAAERDRGPFPYYRHSNGPRNTRQTLQYALAHGFHFGVVASTDDHLGYPGAYGEGLAAVYATENTREAIWDAIRHRRTYGVTGDRIELAFSINDCVMGQVLSPTADRTIAVRVRAWDELEIVEVLRNGTVIHRAFPEKVSGTFCAQHPKGRSGKRYLTPFPRRWIGRIEFGWGPWTALGMARTADWLMALRVRDGRLVGAMPCFQSGPFDEDRRSRILALDGSSCRWQSYTSRQGAFAERPTNAVAFELEGDPRTVLDLTLEKPAAVNWRMSLADLAAESRVEFVGTYPAESVLVHRLVPEHLFALEFQTTDRASMERDEDCYYVRVRQANGHLAWSSPIWVGCSR